MREVCVLDFERWLRAILPELLTVPDGVFQFVMNARTPEGHGWCLGLSVHPSLSIQRRQALCLRSAEHGKVDVRAVGLLAKQRIDAGIDALDVLSEPLPGAHLAIPAGQILQQLQGPGYQDKVTDAVLRMGLTSIGRYWWPELCQFGVQDERMLRYLLDLWDQQQLTQEQGDLIVRCGRILMGKFGPEHPQLTQEQALDLVRSDELALRVVNRARSPHLQLVGALRILPVWAAGKLPPQMDQTVRRLVKRVLPHLPEDVMVDVLERSSVQLSVTPGRLRDEVNGLLAGRIRALQEHRTVDGMPVVAHPLPASSSDVTRRLVAADTAQWVVDHVPDSSDSWALLQQMWPSGPGDGVVTLETLTTAVRVALEPRQ